MLHLDFLGPIHAATSSKFSILVMVDNYTGYTMLHATNGQTAEDVIEAIWNVWRPIHGLPAKIISDRGSGFLNEINLKLYQTMNIRKIFTSSYHPETNAKAERTVQEVKKAYRMIDISLDGNLTEGKSTAKACRQMKLLLPSIQYSINQKIKRFTPFSPNMLVFGKNMNDYISNTYSLDQAMDILRNMRSNKRKVAVAMLYGVAQADGNVDNEELKFFMNVAKALNVKFDK